MGAGRSDDGRLGGGGGSLRISLRDPSSVGSGSFDALWQEPLAAQVSRAVAGDGLLACAGTVEGASREGLVLDSESGPVLLTPPARGGRVRTNLAVLASAPGLRLRVLGRPDRRRGRVLSPVAVCGDDDPHWDVPADWAGLANLAFDDLRASHLGLASVVPRGAEFEPVTVLLDGLEPLERRVGRVVPGGRLSLGQTSTSTTKDSGRLRRRGLGGAADVLDGLLAAPADAVGFLTAWRSAAHYADVAHAQLLAASW